MPFCVLDLAQERDIQYTEADDPCGGARTVFRAISDRASDGMVDAEVAALAGADGSGSLPAVLRLVARHPSRGRTLARLGRDMKIAARAAAVAAAAACAAVVPG
jgi:hypothetical protein